MALERVVELLADDLAKGAYDLVHELALHVFTELVPFALSPASRMLFLRDLFLFLGRFWCSVFKVHSLEVFAWGKNAGVIVPVDNLHLHESLAHLLN